MNQHATALLWHNIGFLLIGPPGSGKSSLAFTLMARGAQLVADDQIILTKTDPYWQASCPPALQNKLHLRDQGIITVKTLPSTHIYCIFQSTLPAVKLSIPPDLGITPVLLDFMHSQAPETIELALTSFDRSGVPL